MLGINISRYVKFEIIMILSITTFTNDIVMSGKRINYYKRSNDRFFK